MLHLIHPTSWKSKPIALIGMTGCGKTTVGKAFAKKAELPFYDLDEEIVRRAGMSVGDIFREKSEAGFREIERETLCSILDSPVPAVLACGGGAILREENRLLLREKSTVIWLWRDPERVLKNRLILRRPPICGQKSNYMALLEKRLPIYSSLADLTLDAEEHTPDEIAQELSDYFGKTS